MILDELSCAEKYQMLSPALCDALEDLKNLSHADLPVGRHDLADGRFVVVQRYDTKLPEQGLWEAHRAYIDIQFVAEGEEMIGYAPISQLAPLGEYEPEKDFQGFTGRGTMLQVKRGSFCIFWPEDVHMPGLSETSSPVKKLVLKVPVVSPA